MTDMFADLQKLGIGNIGDVFEDEKKDKKSEGDSVKKLNPEELEAELIFDKTYTCPLCDRNFTSKTVKTGKAKMISSDMDLRAKYANIDVNRYDVVVCPSCGYAAMTRYFGIGNTTSAQRALIRENISSGFRGLPEDSDGIVTYESAILRFKLAMANAVVKKGKNSEKAYILLKLAWVTRGRREELRESGSLSAEEETRLIDEELEYIKKAYTGFKAAVSSEVFPMCGMDEMTILYIMAALANETGEYDEALKLLGDVLISKTTHARLKDKARDLKEKVLEDKKRVGIK